MADNNIYGLIQSTEGTRFDGTGLEYASGIRIDAEMPEKTGICAIFRPEGGNWQKYDAALQKWVDIEGDITAQNVALLGNTAEELKKLGYDELRPIFVGKHVDFAIALYAATDAYDMPSFKSFDIMDDTVPCGSLVLDEGRMVTLSEILADTKLVGKGKAEILASVKNATGTWTKYLPYQYYIDNETVASHIKFRVRYEVEDIGTDSAAINYIEVRYKGNKGNNSNGSTATCFTKLYQFEKPITNAHLILKHPDTPDTKFEAYICHRAKEDDPEVWIPMTQDKVTKGNKLLVDEFDYVAEEGTAAGGYYALRIDITGSRGSVKEALLGTGTGAVTSYKLPHSAISDTIQVFPIGSGAVYNARTHTLDVTAPVGSQVKASYDWESETTYLDSMSCIFSE